MKTLILTGLAMLSPLHAATVVWDGGGGDGNWETATNWDSDTLPVATDTVNIGSADTVNFAGGNFPSSITINLDGTLNGATATRLNGATINTSSTTTITGGFWDLNNGTINWVDGASYTATNWEHKGTNAFNFQLGAAGFNTLTPGSLNSNGATSTTYNVDMALYTGGEGTIDLVDFGGDSTSLTNEIFNGSTGQYNLNISNVPAGLTAALQWDDATDKIQLVLTPEPSSALLLILGGLGAISRRRRA